MKRWAIRLSAVTAVVAVGWFTVAWAQRQTGAGEETAQGPDFSKPPVNAGQFASTGGGPGSTAISNGGSSVTPVAVNADTSNAGPSNSAPSDPFQGVRNPAGQRYQYVEPQSLDPDPNAAALATDTSEIATKQASHNEPTNRYAPAQEIGNGGATAAGPDATASDEAAKPFDPFASRQTKARVKSEPGTAGLVQPPTNVAVQQQPGDDLQYQQSGQSPGGAAPTADAGNSSGATPPASNPQPINAAIEAAPPASFGGNSTSGNLNNSSRGRYSDVPLPPDDANRRNSAMESLPGNTLNRPSSGSSHYSQNLGGSTREQSILPPRNSQNTLASATDSYAAAGRNLPAGLQGTDPSAPPPPPPVNLEGFGRPGDKKLEGAQTPSVTIQKIAPPEIKVGKPAKFEIIVRNTGPVVADNVEVIESVPQGTTLVSTNPPTQTGQRGEIIWRVGELKPGEESKLQVELMPIAEGEIGSVAVVQFRSQASMRTIATKPELVLELNSPKQVMIGGDVTVGIKISNPGTGAAEKIVLHEVVPPGFQHPAGSELEFEVGTLKPGETRNLDLSLHAVQAGMFGNTISVSGDANLRAEQTAQIQIIAPALEVGINGPGLRYLERHAKYDVSVNNPGTAPAKNVELVTRLPKGMQFVEASDMGHYDQKSHSVIWSLAELPASQSGVVKLTTLAAEPGEQRLRVEGRATGGLSHTSEGTTIVEGVAAVLFTVVDIDDPVEVSGQAVYEIKVVNQGSKAANRVTVNAVLPAEMKPVSAEGPVQHRLDGQRVIFEPMTRLAPKADITYRVVAQAVSPGDSRIKVLLQTDEMNEPVTKEESTRVYQD